MNVRLAVHLLISIVLGLGLVFTGLAVGGPALAVLGFVLWFLLEQLIKALLPTPFHPGVEGAQTTSAVYRGWAARVLARTGLARTRTVEADAAHLAAGVRLCMLSFGLRDGSQTLGHLLLQRSPEGGTMLAWRARGKGKTPQPVDASQARIQRGREQQNPGQARMGFTVSMQLGTDSYWLRSHDAELLDLVLGREADAASPVV
ncbi:hypothetical protein ABIA33_001605 [Streptacidiphilus sp. MAP12-16]|uniref:hypothetical protein n=1 Tax=Streptacidiphilus sp. MAP12-16 TaxID=3156300 RepID=UPI0035145F55